MVFGRRYDLSDLDIEGELEFTDDAHVSLDYQNAPTLYEIEQEIVNGLHTNEHGEIGCPACGCVDMFVREITTKGRRYKCSSCFYNTESTYETVKSRKDITLEQFGLVYVCDICGEEMDSYNKAALIRHMRKHETENQVSEAESFVGMNEKCDDCGIRFGNPARENKVWIITAGRWPGGDKVLMFCNECKEEHYHSTDWDIVQPFESEQIIVQKPFGWGDDADMMGDFIYHPEHEVFLEELKKDYDYEYRDYPQYPWEAAAHIFNSKNGDTEVIFKQLTDAHLDIDEMPQDTYMIFDWLESKNKRQGNAMEMMSAIIKAADKTGTTLFLDCGYHDLSESPDDIPLNKLCEWYETYGFVKSGGHYPRMMVRKPHRTQWSQLPRRAEGWKNFDYPDGTWFTKDGWPRPLGWPNSECEMCGSRKLMATLTNPCLHNNKMSWLCNPCWLKTLGYVKAAEDEEDMRGTFGFPPEGQSLGDEVFGEREGDIWTYPWTPDLFSPVYPIVPADMAHKETAKLRQYLQQALVGQTICLWQGCRATKKTPPDEVCPKCNQSHPWWPTAGLTEALPSGSYGKVMGISEVNPNRAGVIGMWVKVTSGGTEKHPIGSRMWIHIKDWVPAHGATRGWEKGNYIAESWEAETSTTKSDAIDIINWIIAPKKIPPPPPTPEKEEEPHRCVKCDSEDIIYEGPFEYGAISVRCSDCGILYAEYWEYVEHEIFDAEDYEIRRWIKVLRDEDPDEIEVDWDESTPVVPEEDWIVDWDAEDSDEMKVSSHAYDRMSIRLSNIEKQIVENCARKWWKRAVVNGWESLGVVALDLYSHRKTDLSGMASNGDTVVAIVRDGVMTTVMLRRINQPMSRGALRVRKVKWCFRPPPMGRRGSRYYAEDSHVKRKPNCRCGAILQWDAVRTAWYCIECPFNTYPKRAEDNEPHETYISAICDSDYDEDCLWSWGHPGGTIYDGPPFCPRCGSRIEWEVYDVNKNPDEDVISKGHTAESFDAESKQRKKVYKFYSDPMHGWLKVPIDELITLDIASAISSHSYVRGDFAYLEEDSDMTTFTERKEELGQEWEYTHLHPATRPSRIRKYRSWDYYRDFSAESELLPIGWEALPTGQLQKTFNFHEQNAFIPIWNTVFQTDSLSAILKQPTETIVSEDSLNIRLGDSRRNMRSNMQFADILNEFVEG